VVLDGAKIEAVIDSQGTVVWPLVIGRSKKKSGN
jgi:hypothetical protein